ncbi:hypothetical protein D9M70_160650 [compost metagenome]
MTQSTSVVLASGMMVSYVDLRHAATQERWRNNATRAESSRAATHPLRRCHPVMEILPRGVRPCVPAPV